MQLTHDLYKWLKPLGLLQQVTPKQNGRFELDPETTSGFYNGFKIYELLDKLIGPYQQPLKQQTNPTARLFNWNILTERLHQITINLDSDIKQLIIGGDLEMIVEVLKDIYSKFSKTLPPPQEKQKKPLDIETLNSAKQLTSCESIQEFIIVGICQALVLKPRQAQQLLNNNFKLLTHVFIKGVKGYFQPLIQLLQDMYNHMSRLIELCRDEEHMIGFVIQFLKLSLFSKDSEVVQWGLRFIGKIAFDLATYDLLFHVFQWLINGGMQNIILTLQRQPQLAETLAITLSQIACYDYNQVFGNMKYFENVKSYIEFYAPLIPYINCDLLNYNLEQQIQQAIKLGDNSSTRDEKNISIQFLTNSWINYSAFMESNLQIQQTILTIFQKTAKDPSYILRNYTIIQAFKLLDGLAHRKANSAAIVYKKLVSIMIESQNNDFILRQFGFIIQKYPSIPIEILVEGMVKHQVVNVSDCEVYYIISSHQNLRITSAITILDLLMRIYNTSVIFQYAVFITIQQLTQKFIENPEFQEYTTRTSQTSLSLYVNSIKIKKSQNTQSNYQDDSIINQQRRAQIIHFLKYIISLRCYTMNNQLKPLLVGAHLELQSIENRENKGIITLLQLLGDPYNIIEEVVQNDGNQESQLFLEKKIQQMGGGSSNILQEQFLEQNKSMFQKDEDLVQSLLIEEKKDFNKKKTEPQASKRRNYDFDDYQCIYEEGELAYKPQEMTLVDFGAEEDVDRESINMAIKHYSKTFKYLFNKYAISPQEAAKNRLRNLDQSKLTLRSSDVLKILQDFDIYNFSTYEEILTLIKIVNNKYNYFNSNNGSSIEQQSQMTGSSAKSVNFMMDIDTFIKFMVQYAMLIFGRPPKDLRKMPSGNILTEFFKYFAYVARRRNDNHLIFEDPDGVTTVADKQTISKWNIQLLQHPETVIPTDTNLKKVKKENITLSFQMHKSMIGLPDSYVTCFDILNEIIQSKFKTNIVEPTFNVQLIYEVKPIVAKGVHKDDQIDSLLERQDYLKNSLSMLPLEKQEILNKSLDISQVEDKLLNKSIISRMVSESELVFKKELKDLKWKKRKEYLDKQYPKIQEHRTEKEKERVFKQSQETEAKLLEQTTKKPKGAAFIEQKRNELRTFKSEIFTAIKPKTPQVNLEPLMKQVKEKLKSQSLVVKKEREEEKKQPEDNKLQKKKYLEKAKKMADHYDQVKQMKIDFNQKFQNFYQDTGVQAQFKHFRTSGKVAFSHFLKQSDPLNQDAKAISLEGWMNFCRTFNLEKILTPQELSIVFTKTLKQFNYVNLQDALSKNQSYTDETCLKYFEFEFMLLKVAIMGQEYFNKIKSGKDLKTNYEEILKYLENQKKLNKKYKHQEAVMENMKKTNSQTVEAMLGYLDIPQNKELFAGKLRAQKASDVKEITLPKKQSIDMQQIKSTLGLPTAPEKNVSQWKQPGYHGSPEKIKQMEDKQRIQGDKLPFIKKGQKEKELLEKYAKK